MMIYDTLQQTAYGRDALARLEAPIHGPTLELATAPIDPDTVRAVKDCLGDTGEDFGRRLWTSTSVANRLCINGITDKAFAAQFRLMVLEGLDIVELGPVTSRHVQELVDICGGPASLAKETGIKLITIQSWLRAGIPGRRSRWPAVFAMTVPCIFDVKGVAV